MNDPEPFDADAELLDHAAEALAIIHADSHLEAAFAQVLKAKLEAKTATALYTALKTEVNANKRLAARWEAKARKAAMCGACRVQLERDE